MLFDVQLHQLGDPIAFLSANENRYVMLDAGLPPLTAVNLFFCVSFFVSASCSCWSASFPLKHFCRLQSDEKLKLWPHNDEPILRALVETLNSAVAVLGAAVLSPLSSPHSLSSPLFASASVFGDVAEGKQLDKRAFGLLDLLAGTFLVHNCLRVSSIPVFSVTLLPLLWSALMRVVFNSSRSAARAMARQLSKISAASRGRRAAAP